MGLPGNLFVIDVNFLLFTALKGKKNEKAASQFLQH